MKNLKLKIKVNITIKERVIMSYAIRNNNGEILQPANDDTSVMDTLISLYEKNLIRIDFDNDKLFVNDIGRGLLCI